MYNNYVCILFYTFIFLKICNVISNLYCFMIFFFFVSLELIQKMYNKKFTLRKTEKLLNGGTSTGY